MARRGRPQSRIGLSAPVQEEDPPDAYLSSLAEPGSAQYVQNSKGVAVDVSMIPEEAQGRARRPEPWSGYDRSDVEALQRLAADGVEKGFLTYDEIAAAFEDVELTKEQIEDFYADLLDRTVELVEGEQHKQPPHEQPAVAEDVARAVPRLDVTIEPSLDSLRLHLRAIGKGAAARARA